MAKKVVVLSVILGVALLVGWSVQRLRLGNGSSASHAQAESSTGIGPANGNDVFGESVRALEPKGRVNGRRVARANRSLDGPAPVDEVSGWKGPMSQRAWTSADFPRDNAMHYFFLASELLPKVEPDIDAILPKILQEGWKDDPELLALLDSIRPSVEAIRKGLEVGNGQLPPSRGLMEDIPYLSNFLDLGRLMLIEAAAQAARGNAAAAFGEIGDVLAFAAASDNGGGIVNGLVSTAIEQAAFETYTALLSAPNVPPETYAAFMERLWQIDASAVPYAEYVEAESRGLASWYASEGAAGLREFLMSADGAGSGCAPEEVRQRCVSMSDAELDIAMGQVLRDAATMTQCLELPYYEARSIDLAGSIEEHPLSQALLAIDLPVIERQAWRETLWDGLELQTALEQYRAERGTYPASLEELGWSRVDPFTGKPLLYAVTDAGYTLYSAGADMEDDGGKPGKLGDSGTDLVLHQ